MKIQDNILHTPLDDYELLDFGAGRKLERFGDYVIDRPAPQADGPRRLPAWTPDWFYSGRRIGGGEWQAQRQDVPQQWQITLGGMRMHCRLAHGGQLGIYPEHVVCWRWIRQRLEGCSHIRDLRVLNLFAGTGGASMAALQAGASVTHVDAQAAQLELAKLNMGAGAARWIREDVPSFVERAIRRGDTYHMVILDPPTFGRAPGGKVWDVEAHLEALVKYLPRLITPDYRGLWLSIHTTSYHHSGLEQMLREALPGRIVQGFPMGVASSDGRELRFGMAAVCHPGSPLSSGG
jgi:23S rRNA (cytosine1962-C5)-methyltransferase